MSRDFKFICFASHYKTTHSGPDETEQNVQTYNLDVNNRLRNTQGVDMIHYFANNDNTQIGFDEAGKFLFLSRGQFLFGTVASREGVNIQYSSPSSKKE
jgi:hypothetical protein